MSYPQPCFKHQEFLYLYLKVLIQASKWHNKMNVKVSQLSKQFVSCHVNGHCWLHKPDPKLKMQVDFLYKIGQPFPSEMIIFFPLTFSYPDKSQGAYSFYSKYSILCCLQLTFSLSQVPPLFTLKRHIKQPPYTFVAHFKGQMSNIRNVLHVCAWPLLDLRSRLCMTPPGSR